MLPDMSTEIFLVKSAIFLIVCVLLLLLIRIFMRFRKNSKKLEQKDLSQVGFVVDTFHELVSQLKEKEKELDILRKQAEDKASAIEGYNENILQSVPSGVMSFDEEKRLTKINKAAESILEVKADNLIGKYYTELLSSPITDFLAGSQILERVEAGYTTTSGKRVWLGLTVSPLKDAEGSEIGRILVFTDLTHLKAIESQIELRNRLSSLGEISAGIAHELRNPMAVIAGYTKLLSRKADSSLSPTVEAISKEIVVMNRIISDFLSFAKPMELAFKDIDLKRLIEDCVSSIRAELNGIAVKLDLHDLSPIRADEVQLRQALINLIQNSIESMPKGGDLTIATAAKTEDSRNFVVIYVTDTGHGISEDLKEKMFLPFFTTKEKGTGLGLAIVHKIVVSHGGGISADSSEKGTTFKITLPVTG